MAPHYHKLTTFQGGRLSQLSALWTAFITARRLWQPAVMTQFARTGKYSSLDHVIKNKIQLSTPTWIISTYCLFWSLSLGCVKWQHQAISYSTEARIVLHCTIEVMIDSTKVLCPENLFSENRKDAKVVCPCGHSIFIRPTPGMTI